MEEGLRASVQALRRGPARSSSTSLPSPSTKCCGHWLTRRSCVRFVGGLSWKSWRTMAAESDPTEAEIAAACERTRDSWSEAETRRADGVGDEPAVDRSDGRVRRRRVGHRDLNRAVLTIHSPRGPSESGGALFSDSVSGSRAGVGGRAALSNETPTTHCQPKSDGEPSKNHYAPKHDRIVVTGDVLSPGDESASRQ
jgi:hypothetical protein